MQALVLVEGQTEEAFVKRVLCPHYDPKALYFRPTIIETKKIISGGGFRGGIGSFGQFRRHLVRLLGSTSNSEQFIVTTMLDYYGLPADFPGMNTRPAAPARTRVAYVESAIHQFFDSRQGFVP